MDTIYTKIYAPTSYDINTISRYAGAYDITEDINNLITSSINEIGNSLSYRICYKELPILHKDNLVDLSFMTSTSSNLIEHLKNCNSIILFAATIGIELDRLIHKYSSLSPSKALIMQAIGAERIEQLCDTFALDMHYEKQSLNKETVSRYSPGYGDFPIEAQKEIFQALDCSRQIGLTLNESLIMSPSKSVTAIIGVKDIM